MLQPGTRLGPYEIISFLSKGGMGEIFIARDTRLNREVAIKVLAESHLGSFDATVRFEREAKALAALSHPNILTIYDIGTENNVSYVVMELLRGESLRTKLTRGKLVNEELRQTVTAILTGLSVAHSKGIIHRDLKPENIFVTNDGGIKILDFGLAHMKKPVQMETLPDQASAEEIPTQSYLTRSDIFVGTLPYMSPEQIRGGSATTRSDIFSAGVLLYEAATGIHPFWARTVNEVVTKIVSSDPLQIQETKEIPRYLEPILRRALSKDPEERFQDATEMLKELQSTRGIAGSQLRISRNRIIFASVTFLMLLILVSMFLFRKSEPKVQSIRSIAVLPFADRSGQAEAEYLTDGITERIISDLSRIENLKVMASGTVFSYKEKKMDPRQIGKELNVDAVASGSINQQANTIVIQAELMNVKDGSVFWSNRYQGNLSEIVGIQTQLSAEISQKIKSESKGIKPLTTNAEAYQDYLRGRYLWVKFTPESQKKAVEYFNRAIQKDPEYSLAWAGLSDAYGSMATNGWIEPYGAFQMSKTAALKAVSLRSDLAEAQHALGAVLFFYDRDWSASEKQFQRAIDLNPNFADAYCVYSYLLSAQGRTDEALTKVKTALNLNPLDVKSMNDMASTLYWGRNYKEALDQINSILEIVPDYEPALNIQVYVYTALGQNELAIQSGLKAVDVSKGSPIELATLGYAYAVAGRTKDAEEILKNLEQKSKDNNQYISDFYLGHIYTGLGKKDLAFQWFMNACNNWKGDWGMLFIQSSYSDSLRSDARFNELLHCMKFM